MRAERIKQQHFVKQPSTLEKKVVFSDAISGLTVGRMVSTIKYENVAFKVFSHHPKFR